MVGIVVVSHSRALARAAVTLAEQMLQGRHVPLVVAAGLDDGTFGTDAVRIQEALTEADEDGDGVVVLMDLGSAVLSAELAVELLDDDEARQRVLLCPAPLVEGLVVAAVTAVSGASRSEVAAEAMAALTGKHSQLGGSEQADGSAAGEAGGSSAERAGGSADSIGFAAVGEDGATATGRFVVTTENGLHARPTALLVQELRDFHAKVELRNLTAGSVWVPGASLSRVAALGALRGHEVEVRATGEQAGEAVERLLRLAAQGFSPAHHNSPVQSGPAPVGRLTRVDGPFPGSPGIGVGPARLATSPLAEWAPTAGKTTTVDKAPTAGEAPSAGADPGAEVGITREQDRLARALEAVRERTRTVRARVAQDLGEAEATIFDAHLALLDDPELLDDARSRITNGQAAPEAWNGAVEAVTGALEALADPYQRGRAADVRAVGDDVLHHLEPATAREQAGTAQAQPATAHEQAGTARAAATPGGDGEVLVAADLTPARAALLDPARVSAVVLAFGSATAHSTILVRARGIPAVVGAGPGVLDIPGGTRLVVDGTAGELIVDPSDDVVASFRQRAGAARARQAEAEARAGAPATTRDGLEVLVGANLGSPPEAGAAAASGADLAGLVRTEFLFLDRSTAPDVDAQEAVYRSVAAAFAGRRLTLRTLDVGGDKPLPYLPQPFEANPFLGSRGLRLALRHPELLGDQLLAFVRVAHDVPVSVMFPMVSTLDELLAARRVLDTAIAREGRGTPAGLQVGIMVEVPAAALKAAVLAPHVDFFSIGTNDLTQYTLAAERGNEAVAGISDALDPGVLRLIDATCRGAGPGTTVAVCGELAADELAAGLLVGLGVRELSVTPRAVPLVKQAVRRLTLAGATELAARALAAPSAAAVRALLTAVPGVPTE